MKSIFKKSLMAISLTFALTSMAVIAEEAPKAAEATATATGTSNMKDVGYAMGTSLANYVQSMINQQKESGVNIDKADLIAGLQDTLAGTSKMTEEESAKVLSTFSSELEAKATAELEKAKKENTEKGDAFRANFAKEDKVVKTDTGLLYKIEKEGEGEFPKSTDSVVVHYKGTLIDGTEFDSSYARNEPASFRLDQVVPGWTEGLQKIKPGGKIKLVIPPELAYGERGMNSIPANSSLVFEVELLSIEGEAQKETLKK